MLLYNDNGLIYSVQVPIFELAIASPVYTRPLIRISCNTMNSDQAWCKWGIILVWGVQVNVCI